MRCARGIDDELCILMLLIGSVSACRREADHSKQDQPLCHHPRERQSHSGMHVSIATACSLVGQIVIELKVPTEAGDFFAALLRRWKHQDTVEMLKPDNSMEAERKSSGSSTDMSEKEMDSALSEKV